MNAIKCSTRSGFAGLVVDFGAGRIIRLLVAASVTAWAMLLSAPTPAASAEPCPDAEVIFARATGEPPGVGPTGQAFVDSLRSQAGGREVGVYAVNYAASNDFAARMDLARTVIDGIRDAATHIEAMAANCPNTRMVLGG